MKEKIESTHTNILDFFFKGGGEYAFFWTLSEIRNENYHIFKKCLGLDWRLLEKTKSFCVLFFWKSFFLIDQE